MKKITIVIDMQNDFLTGALANPDAVSIIPSVIEEIKTADYVVYTRDTHGSDYMETQEGKKLPVPHCIKGTGGHSIVNEVFEAWINHATGENRYMSGYDAYPIMDMNPIRVEKLTFGSIELQNILYDMNERMGVEEVTLMGLCTGICVMSNAILAKATLPEAQVNVVADCCACVTPESHKTALEAMKLCQINII